jgi:hypothetical protein
VLSDSRFEASFSQALLAALAEEKVLRTTCPPVHRFPSRKTNIPYRRSDPERSKLRRVISVTSRRQFIRDLSEKFNHREKTLTTDQKVWGSSPYGCEGTRIRRGGIRPPTRKRHRWAKPISWSPAKGGGNPYGCGGTRTSPSRRQSSSTRRSVLICGLSKQCSMRGDEVIDLAVSYLVR